MWQHVVLFVLGYTWRAPECLRRYDLYWTDIELNKMLQYRIV